MKHLRNPKLLVALACLLFPAMSFGQYISFYSNPFSLFGHNSRYEVGYSYVMATGQLSGTVPLTDGYGSFIKDTSVARNITGVGFGASCGTTIPLKRVGRRSSISLSMHLVVNEYIWGDLNETMSADGTFTAAGGGESLSGITAQYAFPVGIDYKFGTDAITTKSSIFGFAVGAGAMPQYNLTILDGIAGASLTGGAGVNFGVNPYVKAEVSFRAVLCYKLRAFYSFGNVPLIDQSKNIASATDGPFKLTGKSNLTISFAFLPFSYKWVKKDWWNDFDTRHYYKR